MMTLQGTTTSEAVIPYTLFNKVEIWRNLKFELYVLQNVFCVLQDLGEI